MLWNPARLRGGEWLTAAAVALALIALFGLHWFGARSGWSSATHLRWLDIVAVALGVALVVAQGACRSPALPASLSVLSSVIGFLALLWLALRVVIDPGPHEQVGAWLGLLAGLGLFVGSYWSLRVEGIRPADGPGEIPVIAIPPASGV